MAQLTRLPTGIHINKPFQCWINCEKLAKIDRERMRKRERSRVRGSHFANSISIIVENINWQKTLWQIRNKIHEFKKALSIFSRYFCCALYNTFVKFFFRWGSAQKLSGIIASQWKTRFKVPPVVANSRYTNNMYLLVADLASINLISRNLSTSIV